METLDTGGPVCFAITGSSVTFEEWEDLPYLVKYTGEDNLVVGSDWGHHGGRGRGGDPSGQPDVISSLKAREDVPRSVVEKMLVDNPHRLYGLPH